MEFLVPVEKVAKRLPLHPDAYLRGDIWNNGFIVTFGIDAIAQFNSPRPLTIAVRQKRGETGS